MIKSKIRKQRIDDIDQIYNNLQDLGLFEKFPDLGTLEESYIKTLEKEEDLINRLFKPKDLPRSPDHMWIGINPPPKQYSMKELCDKTISLVKRYKWLEDCMFCVEQNTENGIRPHIHMMVLYTKKIRPIRVIGMLSNQYGVNPNSIECKIYRDGNVHGEHEDYIKNYKKKEKEFLIKKDIDDRKEQKIENFYVYGIYRYADSLHQRRENVHQDPEDNLSEGSDSCKASSSSEEDTSVST